MRWPTSPTSPTPSSTPSSARSAAPASFRSTATNGSGSRKLGIAQIGPANPSRRTSSPRSGVSATTASMRRTTARQRHRETGRQIEGGNPRMRCHTTSGCPRRRTSTAASTARPPCAITMSTGSRFNCRRSARAPSRSARSPPSVRRVNGGRSTSSLPSNPSPSANTWLVWPRASSPRASSTATSSAPRRWLRVTRCKILMSRSRP